MFFILSITVLLTALLLASVTADASRPLFPDSMVADLNSWSIIEKADHLPQNILPAFIGSGVIGIGLDASGMQNLDCKIASNPRYNKGKNSRTDDLYIFRERMISSHLSHLNLMPLGYLEYDLEIDGKLLLPTDLLKNVSNWERAINIREASVRTTLVFKNGVVLSITAFCPYETAMAWFRFELKSNDGVIHRVRLVPFLKLKVRPEIGGGEILDSITSREVRGSTASICGKALKAGKHNTYEDYELGYKLEAFGGETESDDTCLKAIYYLDVSGKPIVRDLVVHCGSICESGNFDRSFLSHKADWANYYDTGASISIGDPLREFLFNNSLYLLRSGGTFKNGYLLQFLLFHPENWFAGTFWDTTFTVDGLIKANQVGLAERFVRWLNESAKPAGRTFAWITRYDGSSAMPSKWKDSGYFVNAAHAMSAIRLYETTQNKNLLKQIIYPLLRKIAVYSANAHFIKEGDHYIGGGTGLDVNQPQETNQTFSTAWFAVVLKKAAEYATILGVDEKHRIHWAEIAKNLKLEKGEAGYFASRDNPKPDHWLSMLLYPTEAMPLVELSDFKRNRTVQCWLDTYGLQQPWCHFWQALSDMRLGEGWAEQADEYIKEGIGFVYGPGYFSEITPRGRNVEGLPPYLSAHSVFLAAIAEQFLSGSIWSNDTVFFANLPTALRNREISFGKLRTSRGLIASGKRSPQKIELVLEGECTFPLKIHLWNYGRFLLRIDNTPVREFTVDNGSILFTVNLQKGKKSLVEINLISNL